VHYDELPKTLIMMVVNDVDVTKVVDLMVDRSRTGFCRDGEDLCQPCVDSIYRKNRRGLHYERDNRSHQKRQNFRKTKKVLEELGIPSVSIQSVDAGENRRVWSAINDLEPLNFRKILHIGQAPRRHRHRTTRT